MNRETQLFIPSGLVKVRTIQHPSSVQTILSSSRSPPMNNSTIFWKKTDISYYDKTFTTNSMVDIQTIWHSFKDLIALPKFCKQTFLFDFFHVVAQN